MNVVDTARERVKHIAEKVTAKVTDAATTDSRVQAITIGRPRAEVVKFFRDPTCLSVIFGDIAKVHGINSHRMRWTFATDEGDGPSWECVVVVEDDIRVRYVDVNPDRSAEIVLKFRDAPQDLGTEVLCRVSSPAPGALTGPLAFKVLYRARALLMTDEVPTIEFNPSARNSDR
jgi:uncharacterized membrane protein